MPAIEDYACEGTLTVGAQSFNNPAFAVLGDDSGNGGLLQLWGLTAELRGEDRIIPSAAGVIPYPRRRTGTRHDLRLLVTGDVNTSGVANANSRTGLYANLGTIKTIMDASLSGAPTAATLTIPTGGPLTAAIRLLALVPVRYGYNTDSTVFEGTLQILIPAGRFV